MKKLFYAALLVATLVSSSYGRCLSGAPSGGENAAASQANFRQAVLDITASADVEIDVCADKVLRNRLPATLFGFNINHYHFQRDIFDVENKAVPDIVINRLKEFPGALYRYPGGLIANRFSWEASVGPVSEREPLRSVKWASPEKLLFGLDDYLAMVDKVGGQPWFVLNLVGWDYQGLFTELDKDYVAASNGRLATHMLKKIGNGTTRYYQLGNELDRAGYQWSHEKYVARSRLSMKAIRKADPEARFVAFLREFNWNYQGAEKHRGISRSEDFVRDVLTGLPEVNDFSMHFYYDARGGKKVHKFLPWRLKHFRKTIDQATRLRAGRAPDVWITEHARGIQFGEVKARDALPYTGNLSAAVSTGDFLIALTQIPEVQGASWHGLNAMPWQLFDPANDLHPNAVYQVMRVLRKTMQPRVLATFTRSPNASGYAGGYDVRAVVLNDGGQQYTVWAANRALKQQSAMLNIPELAGREVILQHYFAAGKAGEAADQPYSEPQVQLDPESVRQKFDAHGKLLLQLPSASVSAFSLQVQ